MPQRALTIDQIVSPDGTLTLVCRGRINLENSIQFRTTVKTLSPHHKFVHADLSGVDWVDSAGLGSLLGTYISAKSDGCDLKLINVHPHVKDLLNITHLNSVFEGKP